MTYTYTDPYGYDLHIRKSQAKQGDVELWTGGVAVDIPAASLPKIVGELYQAAGQEPPILLPRRAPEMSWVTGDGCVRLLLTPGEVMTPDSIRNLCSWYASAADLAEAEAERQRAEAEKQKVQQLAEVITNLDPWSRAEDVARAILAAGYTRSES
ncbi:hypothetical protein ACU635_51025 [[Actinomadura] parvosata]|uniref:hypothetical protein n=1 Tax=[Actinomadura] parvosata TaxID=1955412 RepID=UPI00406C98E3